MVQADVGKEMVVALEGLVGGSPAVKQHARQKALARGSVLCKYRGVEGCHLNVNNGHPPYYCGLLGLLTVQKHHGSVNAKSVVVWAGAGQAILWQEWAMMTAAPWHAPALPGH
jgi:hypothetical protein